MQLTDYPRPEGGSRRGMVWSASPLHPSGTDLDFWLAELQAMQIKWLALLDDGQGSSVELCRRLVAAGIVPVVGLAPGKEEGIWAEETLQRLIAEGVRYFETEREPDVATAWGGRRPADWLDTVVDRFVADADRILKLGGLPGMPALSPGNAANLGGRIVERGRADLFASGAWAAVHNYTLNRPLDYPFDPVNCNGVAISPAEYEQLGAWAWQGRPREVINGWRGKERQPDVSRGGCFLTYRDVDGQLFKALGYHVPIISTAGGPAVGWGDDPRYPRIDPPGHAQLVAAIEVFMSGSSTLAGDTRPEHYLALCYGCLANERLGRDVPGWESQAWYTNRWDADFGLSGQLPAVDLFKSAPGPQPKRKAAAKPAPKNASPQTARASRSSRKGAADSPAAPEAANGSRSKGAKGAPAAPEVVPVGRPEITGSRGLTWRDAGEPVIPTEEVQKPKASASQQGSSPAAASSSKAKGRVPAARPAAGSQSAASAVPAPVRSAVPTPVPLGPEAPQLPSVPREVPLSIGGDSRPSAAARRLDSAISPGHGAGLAMSAAPASVGLTASSSAARASAATGVAAGAAVRGGPEPGGFAVPSGSPGPADPVGPPTRGVPAPVAAQPPVMAAGSSVRVIHLASDGVLSSSPAGQPGGGAGTGNGTISAGPGAEAAQPAGASVLSSSATQPVGAELALAGGNALASNVPGAGPALSDRAASTGGAALPTGATVPNGPRPDPAPARPSRSVLGGKLAGLDGNPAAWVTVKLSSAGVPLAETQTRSDGAFRFQDLGPGAYDITLANITVAGVALDGMAKRGVKLSLGAAGAQLGRIEAHAPGAPSGRAVLLDGECGPHTATLDAGGNCAFDGLPPGRYRLALSGIGVLREAIDLAGGGLFKLICPFRSSLSGQVLDAPPGMVAMLYAPLAWGWSRQQPVDAEGHFTFSALPPGCYRLCVGDRMLAGLELTGENTVVVPAVNLHPGAASLSGRVCDAAGLPQGGLPLVLRRRSLFAGRTYSAADGSYRFCHLAAGDYAVEAEGQDYVLNGIALDGRAEAARDVVLAVVRPVARTVTRAATPALNATMAPGGGFAIEHYVLFGPLSPDEEAETRLELSLALDYVRRTGSTGGFSLDEARRAARVTIVGARMPASTEAMLRASGCRVERLGSEGFGLARAMARLAATLGEG